MFLDLIGKNEVTFFIYIIISIIAGFLIGFERESRGKDAGISTHILVITGSMIFTFLSIRVDPESTSRIAAQIVSGIGFLGAGLILKKGVTVKNLTTAASIWFAGAIGMAIGFGFYTIAIMSTIIGIFAPRVPHFNRNSSEYITKKK